MQKTAWHPLQIEFTNEIYNGRFTAHHDPACGETSMPQASQAQQQIKVMGDKSPKSNQKKVSQKQASTSSAAQKKAAAVASKQVADKKR